MRIYVRRRLAEDRDSVIADDVHPDCSYRTWRQFIWLINRIFVGRFGMVELDFPELGEVEDTRLSMRASMVIILALSFGLWAVMLAPFGTFQ